MECWSCGEDTGIWDVCPNCECDYLVTSQEYPKEEEEED